MSAPALDKRTHRDVIIATLTDTLDGHVYEYGTVPGVDVDGTMPDIFVMLAISRRYVPNLRLSGLASTSGWRIETRHVGDTANNADAAAAKVAAVLDGLRITVDGIRSTPITVESDDAVRKDDDRWSGFARWTYAL